MKEYRKKPVPAEPPDAFVSWWTGHDHCPQRCTSPDGTTGWSSGIDAYKAWQVACYRFEFKERRREHAGGTGVNYAYYGWHRDKDIPCTSNPRFLMEHQAWCLRHGKPDPTISKPLTQEIRHASSFEDVKAVMAGLTSKMDMNKAIDWTKEDSEKLVKQP